MSVTVTGTWTSDSNSDNTAPSSVLFSVQSSAIGNCQNNGNPEQAGMADDGLHDPFDPNAQSPGTSDTPKPEYQPSQSGSISITLPLSASGSGTPGLQGSGGASASVGPITISIHAQPYDFQRTNFTDETPPTSVVISYGELSFNYTWSSTSGVLADLAGETVHENVAAPSSPTVTVNGTQYYSTDTPPFFWNPPVLLDNSTPAQKGQTEDHNSYGSTTSTLAQSFKAPYKVDSFVLSQTFVFNDPTVMAAGVEQPVPGKAGPFTINDAVVVDNNSPSGYSFIVTKDNTPSLPVNLP